MESFFQEKGRTWEEGVALLCGRPARKQGTVDLTLLILPAQESWPLMGVTIPGTELSRLNRVYEEHGSILYCKVHTHPEEAFHSPVDDANPLMQFDGGVSIVLPYCCSKGLNGLRDAAVFRYTSNGWRWVPLSRRETRELLVISPTVEGTVVDRTRTS